MPALTSPALDTPTGIRSQAAAAAKNQFPATPDPAWRRDQIDPTRWDKTYPYQFLVVEAVPGSGDDVSYRIVPGWRFTLPMPPESVTKDRPYAIALDAQSEGVLEEHNGLVFVPISVHGTCGVLPLRGTAEQAQTPSAGASVIGGTIQALGNLKSAASDVGRVALGDPLTATNVHAPEEFASGDLSKTSGYYQTRLLAQFLDSYATMKKDRKNRALSLAFCAWKEEEVYLVTPRSFRLQKTGASPMEWTYDIQLTAWASVRIDSSGSGIADSPVSIRRDPGLLARVLDTVLAARKTVAAATTVVSAVVGDAGRLVTEPLRETTLFCKDLQGAALTVYDLPKSLQQQVVGPFAAAAAAAAGFPGVTDAAARAELRSAAAAGTEMGAATPLAPRPGGPAVLLDHPALKLGPAALDSVRVDDLALPPDTARRVAAERSRIAGLTRDDFATRRDGIRAVADRLAVGLGVGSASYEETYAVSSPRIKSEPSDADWDALAALNDAAMALDRLAATADGSTDPSPMDAMAALSERSGIAFKTAKSKFAVPFPHGRGGLEKLALAYLGDATRWPEIAALNGLRSPYVDEEGWSSAMVVNGAADRVSVAAGSIPDTYTGQTVYLRSSTVRRTHRRVVGTEVNGDVLTVLLDGPATDYLVADAAVLEGFLPGTVNSQQLVYIPSDAEPADDPAVTRAIPGVGEFDPLVAVGGVDLLLTDTDDLIVTPDGDTPLAVGMANLIQNWRVRLRTPLGSLTLHPEEGRPQSVGKSTRSVDARATLRAVQRMFSDDPAVESVAGLRVSKAGPAVRIGATVHVRGVEQPIPVTYHVRTGAEPPDKLD